MEKRNIIKYYLPLLLSLFLLRFPPIYYLGIHSIIFTTHVLSILILLNYFFFYLYDLFENRSHIKMTPAYFIILVFIITQGLSLFGGINEGAFLQRYSKLIIGFAIYIVFSNIVSFDRKLARKWIMYMLLAGSLVAISFQLLIFFYPNLYLSFGSIFISENELDITKANLGNDKLFDASFLWTIIPIIIFFYVQAKKNWQKVLFMILIAVFGFIAFASNFRYAFITFMVSVITSYGVLGKKSMISIFKKESIFFAICIASLIFVYINIMGLYSNYTVIDRLLIQNERYDYGSISWRIRMFSESIQMGLSSSLIGVGLGNFYDNLPNDAKRNITYDYNVREKITEGALVSGPHNIFFQTFAETGFLGFAGLIIMLGFFVTTDIPILKKKRYDQQKTFILCFWTLILIAQAFPPITLSFYVMFFLLRAAIF